MFPQATHGASSSITRRPTYRVPVGGSGIGVMSTNRQCQRRPNSFQSISNHASRCASHTSIPSRYRSVETFSSGHPFPKHPVFAPASPDSHAHHVDHRPQEQNQDQNQAGHEADHQASPFPDGPVARPKCIQASPMSPTPSESPPRAPIKSKPRPKRRAGRGPSGSKGPEYRPRRINRSQGLKRSNPG